MRCPLMDPSPHSALNRWVVSPVSWPNCDPDHTAAMFFVGPWGEYRTFCDQHGRRGWASSPSQSLLAAANKPRRPKRKSPFPSHRTVFDAQPSPRSAVITCHIRPMARGSVCVPPQKILKAPLSAQLGIGETSSGGTQREGRHVEFRELFRTRGNRPTKRSLRVIGHKTAGIGGGASAGRRGPGRRASEGGNCAVR